MKYTLQNGYWGEDDGNHLNELVQCVPSFSASNYVACHGERGHRETYFTIHIHPDSTVGLNKVVIDSSFSFPFAPSFSVRVLCLQLTKKCVL